MSAPIIIRAVLIANSGVTALVNADNIIADDVAPQSLSLPFILVKHVTGSDRHPLKQGDSVFQRKRAQVEIHAANAPERTAIKKAVRAAGFANPLPEVAGFENITLHTEGEGPDFLVPATSVRIGEQDFMITYSETLP